MSVAPPTRALLRPELVEDWLAALGLEPVDRDERDGIASWDLVLDGRRRFDLRITVILDPGFALICWAHYAPPINDSFRRSYRRLLRWNDELPFAKFSLAEDDRPVLATEIALGRGGVPAADDLGLALARLLAIADRLLDESTDWLVVGGRLPSTGGRISRGERLLARYAAQLGELLQGPEPQLGADV